MKISKSFMKHFIYNTNAIENIFLEMEDIENHIDHLEAAAVLKKEFVNLQPHVSNQYFALKAIERNTNKVPNIQDICILHATAMKGFQRDAGVIRRFPVFIGGREAVEHEKIQELLRNWSNLWGKTPYKTWSDKKAADHRHFEFERIHPFSDGNGRVGRLLHVWDLLHHGGEISFMDCFEFQSRQLYYDDIEKYVEKDHKRILKKWKRA